MDYHIPSWRWTEVILLITITPRKFMINGCVHELRNKFNLPVVWATCGLFIIVTVWGLSVNDKN